MNEQIEKLWVGADFIYMAKRYCLIYINASDKECLAVKLSYDEPHVTGNSIVYFNYGELVEYISRGSSKASNKSEVDK